MKKVALTLASVLAAAAFAPEASAVPSFARQTGMACSACHFQKFPVLNGFGRAFKAGGYTMMGAQEKVEGEHLSIPGVLNASLLAKVRYVQDSGPTKTADLTTTKASKADGQLQFGDELSLFFGGRVAETEGFSIGFLFEGNTVGSPLAAGLKLPITKDLGGAKLSIVPFTTDALGPQYGYELSSGGVMRANRFAEQRRETSAIQYNADQNPDETGNATGTALVLANDFGYINYTAWTPVLAPGGNGQALDSSAPFSNSYVRAAVTPTVAGWAIVAGGGMMGGTGYRPASNTKYETAQTFFDFQAHGEIAGLETGVYAQYANAPAVAAGSTSYYGATTTKARTATTIAADVSVVPHALTVGAAYRQATKSTATKDGDNAVTLFAVYDLTQNVALHADYATYSGTAHDAATDVKNQLLLMLEAAW